MLQASSLKFLKDLKKHNDKAWFDEHKQAYQSAKEDFENLTQQLIQGIAKFDESVAHLQPKDCTFRIYKDVRFSKDKTPYKTNMGAYMSKGGKKSPFAGYYFQFEPGGKSFVAGGIWMPEAPILKKVRQEIDYNFADFSAILSQKEFIKLFKTVEGEALKNAPQGYNIDNPAIEYLKLKSFIVSKNIPDELLTQPTLAREIIKLFAAMQPFNDFLNTALAE
ncbi:uncharacterized protein (TIGR02453 family) [Chitinophaga skermanii]|uniref:Uncharacterized protein (TIGR02453 family) n=1 Tax=Chitinophaga skermanii TaxID=331697 RepID=A0A327QCX0_9BACT|nr:DUF2461 domain-containing protein [Chitinophaga skermanii]RAJ01688.1 uncharacterized protein (TIGR02453 family) [Chitinophaga skermanii]